MQKVEVKSVLFRNFTLKEFVCSWDGVPYRFPSGKEMYVEDWKAEHFAKHLVDRVMHERGMIITNMVERSEFLKLALPGEEISNDEALDLNAREEVAEAKEKVKSKKDTKKVEKEEEFPTLKTKKIK